MVRRFDWMKTAAVLAGMLLVLPPASAAPAEETVAAARAEDPNAKSDKPLPAPPAKVKVEGKLPYVPTSNSIATRLPQDLRLTPFNIGVVQEPLLREQGAVVLGDALRNVSGVNVQTLSGAVDSFQLRGYDSITSGLVLTDGVREPETTFFQMYNVERVEVFKGPGGFLYGADPMAGVVNVVRRQPQAGTFGSAGAGYGAFNTQSASVDYNQGSKGGTFAFRVNSAWWQSDGYRDGRESNGYGVNPAFTWRLGEKTSLNVNLELVGSDYKPDGGIPLVGDQIADVPRTRSYQTTFDKSDQSLGRGQVDLETRLSDSWTLRNKLYYRDLDWDSDGTLLLGVAPSFMTGRLEVFRALTRLDDRQTILGDRVEGILSTTAGTVENRLMIGVESQRYGDDFTFDVANLPNIDLLDPQETATHPLQSIPGQLQDVDSRSLVLAPYVIDQIRFSEQWHVLGGVRLDIIDFQVSGEDQDRRDQDFSPMGGVVFAPNETLSFYGNVGGSFSPPSSRVAEHRRPERSRQYEAGAKVNILANKLTFTVAAYSVDRQNIAIPDDNGFTQQSGDQRAKGIELEVAAEPFSGFRTFLSYAYNDPELTEFSEQIQVFDPNFGIIFVTVDRSGNDPAFAPHHIANFWVSHRFDKGLGLAGGARYVSGQFIDEDNQFAIDGYITLDAAVSYAIGKWDLGLKLSNLTDRDYETGAFPSNAVLPAPGFAAYGSVQRRF